MCSHIARNSGIHLNFEQAKYTEEELEVGEQFWALFYVKRIIVLIGPHGRVKEKSKGSFLRRGGASDMVLENQRAV